MTRALDALGALGALFPWNGTLGIALHHSRRRTLFKKKNYLKYCTFTIQLIVYSVITVSLHSATKQHLPLSGQAVHGGIDTLIRHTCMHWHSLCITHNAHVLHMEPPSISCAACMQMALRTDNTQEHTPLQQHFFFPLAASFTRPCVAPSNPPPTSPSGRNQWALSSAECDVTWILTVPEGELCKGSRV